MVVVAVILAGVVAGLVPAAIGFVVAWKGEAVERTKHEIAAAYAIDRAEEFEKQLQVARQVEGELREKNSKLLRRVIHRAVAGGDTSAADVAFDLVFGEPAEAGASGDSAAGAEALPDRP